MVRSPWSCGQTALTILTCTRNGARAIADSLGCTIVSATNWSSTAAEIIVVDNDSTDDTVSVAKDILSAARIKSCVLSAPKPGKINAILTGVRAASSELICLVDDDNQVEPDYFERLHAFFNTYPRVGVVGGGNHLDPRILAPVWFAQAKHHMACSRPRLIKNVITDSEGREIADFGWVAGAGMGFRVSPLLAALSAGYTFFNDTRRGPRMGITGEDTEMCVLFSRMGYQLGYDPTMRLSHNIANDRLTLDAYWKLCRTIGAGSPGIQPFFFEEPISFRIPRALQWSWQWQAARNIYRMIRSVAPLLVTANTSAEDAFRRRVTVEQYLGCISRILMERGRYSEHIRQVQFGHWRSCRIP